MNGAESLVRTLVAGGVDVSFSNPGTSEMHFVAALDRVEGMRCVLGLFEGVVTGAADGYGRMTGRPARLSPRRVAPVAGKATIAIRWPRQWLGQPSQRQPGPDTHRQHHRRSRHIP